MYSYGPPTHGRAKAGQPARTYIQQLCEDTGCCPEDLPWAMNDREKWQERVRDIRATSAIWWWWLYTHTLYMPSNMLAFFKNHLFLFKSPFFFLFFFPPLLKSFPPWLSQEHISHFETNLHPNNLFVLSPCLS